jgi:alcohol dehydrogenase (cytochrome c)
MNRLRRRFVTGIGGVALMSVAQFAMPQAGNEWPIYGGDQSNTRYSTLKQITTGNVKNLRVAWMHSLGSLESQESTPLIVGDTMYVTTSTGPKYVFALDARTGKTKWKYEPELPNDYFATVCCGLDNRGVAYANGKLFVGRLDAKLVALDANSGKVLWTATVADYKKGHAITSPPLPYKNLVVSGMAGGEYGVRGFLDAYDVKTGKRAWRFYTVPAAGEKGVETWEGESWKTGSATTWVTGAYDPQQNLVLWGTGNPGPDWNGVVRKGDNLYSDSLIALDLESGALKWHFQFTPHDDHDWDAVQVPVLMDGTFRGQPRKMVLFANRNGFYYVLDRVSGKYLASRELSKQTWAKEIDDNGRPVVLPGVAPTVAGTKVYPAVGGSTNWFSPSYSPKTNLFYVPVREEGGIYYEGEADYKPGAMFNGGGFRSVPGEEPWGAVRALKPQTGEVQWEFKTQRPPVGGVMATAGGLVFGGTAQGEFFALDAASGKSLWNFRAGGAVYSNPISYLSGGKQQVAIAAGHAIFAFGLE